MNQSQSSGTAKNYKWCFKCEQASPKKELRSFQWQSMQVEGCPNPNCDGTELDFWKWSSVRMDEKTKKERYPEIPEKGVRYPLN